ncbi:SMI1/KNR4 family protein [Alkalicoccobacillus murimartini]|uniref:Knr4/Smi1-like domain-containing protein n=1 Tax=Alkalicoccobacillus murimartini TaxID=171685 RepID=A0ABT9YJZ1_9BACI|nr:SMI1/KNR4 family protein [Alkalicoccobacillus murimartini]MDQ0207344.1 hypothetical protein [Alkalicoccobacillus murimartini]
MTQTYWTSDIFDEYELAPLTDSTIQGVEKQLNIRFPKAYLDLLKVQNGGYLHLNQFPYAYEYEDGSLPIDLLYGLSLDPSEGVLQSSYLIKEWDLPSQIVLLSGDGSTWVALDYRQNQSEPSVAFFDIDLEFEATLAESFDEFLSKLYKESDDEEDEFEEDQIEFSYEQGKKVFSGHNIGKISSALLYFINTDSDTNWLLSQLKKVVVKEDEFIVQDAAVTLYRIIDKRFDEEGINRESIQEVIDMLKNHSDRAIQNFSKKAQRLFDEKQA